MSTPKSHQPMRIHDYQDTCINGDGDDLSASRTYGWQRTHNTTFSIARLVIYLAASAARSGSIRIQGAHKDRREAAFDLDTDLLAVHGNSNSLTIGAGVIRMEIAFEDLPYEVRAKYTATANGADGDVLDMFWEFHN